MKNKLLFSAFAVMVLACPAIALADNVSIPSTVTFNPGVTISKTQDMTIGIVDFSGTPGAGDHVDVGTDGTLTQGGNFAPVSGTGTAGEVQVTTGTNGQDVDVFCVATAHLTDGAGTEYIDATGIKVALQNATGDYSSAGSLCQGLGTAATTFTLNTGTLDTVRLGATLVGNNRSAGFGGGDYSTMNSNGQNIQVDMFYH